MCCARNFQLCRLMLVYLHQSTVKLAIHLSFLAFRHVRALFCELFHEIANQSLYTSHNITDFVHLWFCEELDEKLVLLSSLTFLKIPIAWRERWNARWEKWLTRRFTKCHLYTSRFSRFAHIFLRSRQFDDKCIAGFMVSTSRTFLCNSQWQERVIWSCKKLWYCIYLPTDPNCEHNTSHFISRNSHHRECFLASPRGVCVPTNIQCIQASHLHLTHFVTTCMANAERFSAVRKRITACTSHSPDTHLGGSSIFT